jgi:hypothetical protein
MEITLFGRKRQLTFGDTKTVQSMKKKAVFDRYERRKHEGIEASFFHADTDWKRAAADRVYWLAKHRHEFTADDVIEFLDAKGITTGNNSALGAIMQAAQRMGIITNSGHFKESRRPVQHSKPLRIWHSNIYKKGRRNGNR